MDELTNCCTSIMDTSKNTKKDWLGSYVREFSFMASLKLWASRGKLWIVICCEYNFWFKSIFSGCAVQIYIPCSISQPFCCSRWWCYIHYSESLTQMMGCTKGLYIEWFCIMAADTQTIWIGQKCRWHTLICFFSIYLGGT